jgi:hypothetical protein
VNISTTEIKRKAASRAITMVVTIAQKLRGQITSLKYDGAETNLRPKFEKHISFPLKITDHHYSSISAR